MRKRAVELDKFLCVSKSENPGISKLYDVIVIATRDLFFSR